MASVWLSPCAYSNWKSNGKITGLQVFLRSEGPVDQPECMNSPNNKFTSSWVFLVLMAMLGALLLMGLLNSLQSILATAPYLVLATGVLILGILKAKGMLYFPWLFIPLGVLVKFLSWFLLATYWPQLAGPEHWWPYTGHVYYLFDVLGSLIILGFSSYIISKGRQGRFRRGLIADSSLLFVTIMLVAAIFYKDVLDDYFISMTPDNFLVRLQVLPFLYTLFVSLVMLLVVGTRLGNDQLAYFMCIIPFSMHVFIEAYASYVYIAPDQQLAYARVSALCYYLTALVILVYMIRVNKDDGKLVDDRCNLCLSPLVLLSGAVVLTVPTLSIYYQQSLSGADSYHTKSYLFVFIAGIALFLRFLMLIKYAERQQSLLDAEASRDDLTSLLNRRGFLRAFKALEVFPDPGKKTPPPVTLLCLLDVDMFKSINDTHGHHIGDQVLCHIARRLNEYPDVLLAGRLGGDEFVFLLRCGAVDNSVLESLHRQLNSWQVFGQVRLLIRVSIGATLMRRNSAFSNLYTAADNALYRAKNEYSGTVINTGRNVSANAKEQSINELIATSLEQQRILLYFQPIYDLKLGCMTGVEVLMRLQDDKGRVYMPSEFLELAAKQNKMLALTKLLVSDLGKVATQLAGLKITLNFPPYFFEDELRQQEVMAILAELPVPRDKLLLEITEEFNSDIQVLMKAVSALRKQGYYFALDDFGAGSASLSRLAYLSVDIVKIDISLLRAAEQGNIAPLESIVKLARRLRSEVVIEGIETATQLEIAQTVRAHMGQGFYLSQPVRFEQLLALPRKSALLTGTAKSNSLPNNFLETSYAL